MMVAAAVVDGDGDHETMTHKHSRAQGRKTLFATNILSFLVTTIFVINLRSFDGHSWLSPPPRSNNGEEASPHRLLQIDNPPSMCCQCSGTCITTTATITLNDLADVTSWRLFEIDDMSGDTIELIDQVERGHYEGRADGDVENINLGCLINTKCYEIFLRVLGGDGGPVWSIQSGNDTLVSSEGFFFGEADSIRFGNCREQTCAGRETILKMELGIAPEEIFWALYEMGGSLPTSFKDVGVGAYERQLSETAVSVNLGCLDAQKCYLIEMRDFGGANNGIQWSILFNGEETIQGRPDFSISDLVPFGESCDAFFGPPETQLVGSCGGEQDRFNLCIAVAPGTPPALADFYDQAAKRWESIIIGDRGNDIEFPVDSLRFGFLRTSDFDSICGFETGIPTIVDDIFVCADFGLANRVAVLGYAFSIVLRDESEASLPIVLGGKFVIASLGLANFPLLTDIIIHELGHILGIGSNWAAADLTPPRNPLVCNNYMGPNAIREYQSLSGCEDDIPPVEDSSANAGSYCSHWAENCFRDELMTPSTGTAEFLPISRVTVGTLQDLGYAVNYSNADPYTADDLDPSCRCDADGRKLQHGDGHTRSNRNNSQKRKLSRERRMAAAEVAEEEMEKVKSTLANIQDIPTSLLGQIRIHFTVFVESEDGAIREVEFTDSAV